MTKLQHYALEEMKEWIQEASVCELRMAAAKDEKALNIEREKMADAHQHLKKLVYALLAEED